MARLLAFVILFLGACSAPPPATSSQTSDDPSLITALTEIADLEDCPNGGFVLDHGFDQNGNGVLDAAEIRGSNVACHGADGKPGDDGPEGPPGLEGPAGEAGAAGVDGVDGADGPTGTEGPAGADGMIFSAARPGRLRRHDFFAGWWGPGQTA